MLARRREHLRRRQLTTPFAAALVCLLALALTPPRTSAQQANNAEHRVVKPFSAQYTLKRAGVPVASVTRELKALDNNHYLYQAESKPIGIAAYFVKDMIVERSRWQIVDNQLRPSRYSYERTGGKRERIVKLVFDWQALKVTNTINNDAWKMSIPPGTQDKLLYQLSIMRDLSQGKTTLSYDVADGGKLKKMHFSILKEEPVVTKLGTFKTVAIQRSLNGKVTTIWCAKERHYLPVKIEQNDEDGEFQLYIDSVTGL